MAVRSFCAKELNEMSEQWALNGFYDMSKMTALFNAIPYRESCRRFASAPSTQQWEALTAAAEKLAMPGTRLALGMCDTALFQPFMGLLMKFENVRRFAAIIVKGDSPAHVINAGISGEMLMLAAVNAGLGGVWVAGTYKKGQVSIPLDEEERVVAVMALGVPQKPPKPPLKRHRKELIKICSPNFSEAPVAFREVALTVQAAPSAMNLQPWLLTYEPENTLTISIKKPQSRLDLGIALCHAALALGSTPVRYTLAADGLSARITL